MNYRPLSQRYQIKKKTSQILNSSPENRILDLSNLKFFVDDKLNPAHVAIYLRQLRIFCAKIADYQPFLLSATFFFFLKNPSSEESIEIDSVW